MKYSKLTYSRSIVQQVLSIALMAQPSVVALSALLLPLIAAPAAQALPPLPKDWCGRLWTIKVPAGGVGLNASIRWDDPTTGASATTAPPNIAAIPDLTTVGSTDNFAALGIHARTGTLYTYNRTTAKMYQYRMGADPVATSWTQTDGPPNTGGLNKMTVTGDTLYLASSNSLNVYTFPIDPATGTLGSRSGSVGNYSLSGLPSSVTVTPSGGDLAQDEYLGTYNMNYDTPGPNVYIYKQSGTSWVYQATILKNNGDNTEQFGGFAFYNGDFYLKGNVSGKLYKVDSTYNGDGTTSSYTWPSSLAPVNTTATDTVTDLASCGVPALNVSKTQSIYTDAAATTLTTNQTQLVTNQYIKYTITLINGGDAWARGAFLKDDLPAGVEYVPNSATQNGTNLNAATYPFTNAVANSSGLPTGTTGQIRLPFGGNSSTATYTYLVRVTGTAPTVANKVEAGYVNPYPSDPADCTTGLNCATSPLGTLLPSIFGTVWNDKNGSAAGTFSNIFTAGETGTNTGSPTALNALLLNSAGNILATTPVTSNGTYSFPGLASTQSGLKIELSTTPGTVGSSPPVASIPAGWKATSPKIQATPFNLATIDITNQDFGISLPAGTILVKRITGIKPAGSTTVIRTTNPNEITNPTALNTFVHNPADTVIAPATTPKDQNPNWPTNYIVGAFNAGLTQPGDEIEYTIYYLNTRGADTKNLKICDPIRGRQSYVAGTMQLQPGGVSTPFTLTDTVNTTIDRANAYGAAALPAVVPMPTNCNAANATSIGVDSGGVAVQITGSGSSGQPDLPALPSDTIVTPPATPYGWFRFRTKVNN